MASDSPQSVSGTALHSKQDKGKKSIFVFLCWNRKRFHSLSVFCASGWGLFARDDIGVCVRLSAWVHVYVSVRSCWHQEPESCLRGVALSVHLSDLESSHSATPVAVRALLPLRGVSLPSPPLPSPPSLHRLPSLPPASTSPPPHSCLLSCVHWPSVPLLGPCPVYLTHLEQRSHPHVNTRDAHGYCHACGHT